MSNQTGAGKYVSPWLSKGSSHILRANTPKPPPNATLPSSANPISGAPAMFRDYTIHYSHTAEEESVEDCFNALRNYVFCVKDNPSMILEDNGKATDSSILDEYETVGLVNECNNCYQNSVLQVVYVCEVEM